ncbi:hypothetical protein PInf_017329 [Phytophthora infestans]|nr:hypothetical protein PInf_017329 [Phytophthora infestans]
MARIPEVPLTTDAVTIDDFQMDPGASELAEVDRLRQKIWESRHCNGKRNIADLTSGYEKTEDEQICYHEGGDLHAEDLGEDMALIPEVPLTTDSHD